MGQPPVLSVQISSRGHRTHSHPLGDRQSLLIGSRFENLSSHMADSCHYRENFSPKPEWHPEACVGCYHRTEAAAKTSDICERAYSPSSVHELFEGFRSQAENSLLFLKSVSKLSVHVRAAGSQSPQLLFSATASTQVLCGLPLEGCHHSLGTHCRCAPMSPQQVMQELQMHAACQWDGV